jgi:hypothetical protein
MTNFLDRERPEYEPDKGTNIREAAEQVLALAEETYRLSDKVCNYAFLIFNDIRFSVRVGETVDDVVKRYHELSEDARSGMTLDKFYLLSPAERESWMASDEHVHDCAAANEGQACCLDKLLRPKIRVSEP